MVYEAALLFMESPVCQGGVGSCLKTLGGSHSSLDKVLLAAAVIAGARARN
jgi:hypothetical protein